MREGLWRSAPVQAAAARRLARRVVRHAQWRHGAIVLGVFALSQLAFYLVATAATWLLPQAGTSANVADVTGRSWLNMHWRWDAVHYYSIATGGYGAYQTQGQPGTDPNALFAFFPLFPLFIRGVATLLNGFRAPAAVRTRGPCRRLRGYCCGDKRSPRHLQKGVYLRWCRSRVYGDRDCHDMCDSAAIVITSDITR
jgi:hypothetical protein